MANSQDLESMKLPELKELAKQMGLRGTSTMRKPELLATLQAARSGGEAPAGVTVKAPKTKAGAAKGTASKAGVAKAAESQATEQAEAKIEAKPKNETKVEVESKDKTDSAKAGRRERSAGKDAAKEAVDLLSTLDLGLTKDDDRRERKPRRRLSDDLDDEVIIGNVRRRRHRKDQDTPSEGTARDLDDILSSLPSNNKESRGDDDARRTR